MDLLDHAKEKEKQLGSIGAMLASVDEKLEPGQQGLVGNPDQRDFVIVTGTRFGNARFSVKGTEGSALIPKSASEFLTEKGYDCRTPQMVFRLIAPHDGEKDRENLGEMIERLAK